MTTTPTPPIGIEQHFDGALISTSISIALRLRNVIDSQLAAVYSQSIYIYQSLSRLVGLSDCLPSHGKHIGACHHGIVTSSTRQQKSRPLRPTA